MSTTSSPNAAAVRSGLCDIGGAQLYYELRGTGPTLLFIPGASGDAGSFEAAAQWLADRYTVLIYDRRAHSRSPWPEGWSHTSIDEQGDDAAALLRTLGLAPAHVFGTSSGATIGLNLALRHPQVVRNAVLHEPPKIGVLPQRDELLATLRARMDAARREGGDGAAMANFIGWIAGSSEGDMAAAAMARVLGNGTVWLDQELGVVDRYDAPDALVDEVRVPIAITVGSEGATALHQDLLQGYAQTLQALADRLGGRLQRLSGAHVPYRTDPALFARELRELLAVLPSASV